MMEGESQFTIEAKNLSSREMAVIMRFCRVRGNEAPQSIAGGFVRTPEYIQFRKGKKEWLHKTNGEDFVARRVKTPNEENTKELAAELYLDEPGSTRLKPFDPKEEIQ